MGDKKSVVVGALKSLHTRGMRFSVSVVMWPNIDWKELESTIRYADSCEPYTIIAILPGYTDRFSDSILFDTVEYWNDTVLRLAALRFGISTPLIAHPRLHEENALGYPANEALVIGITPRSSAARAGLRIGDIITGIDEFNPIYSRRQVDSLLLLKHQQGVDTVDLFIRRGASDLHLRLVSRRATLAASSLVGSREPKRTAWRWSLNNALAIARPIPALAPVMRIAIVGARFSR